jgi:hypothetical protein
MAFDDRFRRPPRTVQPRPGTGSNIRSFLQRGAGHRGRFDHSRGFLATFLKLARRFKGRGGAMHPNTAKQQAIADRVRFQTLTGRNIDAEPELPQVSHEERAKRGFRGFMQPGEGQGMINTMEALNMANQKAREQGRSGARDVQAAAGTFARGKTTPRERALMASRTIQPGFDVFGNRNVPFNPIELPAGEIANEDTELQLPVGFEMDPETGLITRKKKRRIEAEHG